MILLDLVKFMFEQGKGKGLPKNNSLFNDSWKSVDSLKTKIWKAIYKDL